MHNCLSQNFMVPTQHPEGSQKERQKATGIVGGKVSLTAKVAGHLEKVT